MKLGGDGGWVVEVTVAGLSARRLASGGVRGAQFPCFIATGPVTEHRARVARCPPILQHPPPQRCLDIRGRICYMLCRTP